jgi:hypothetical protein
MDCRWRCTHQTNMLHLGWHQPVEAAQGCWFRLMLLPPRVGFCLQGIHVERLLKHCPVVKYGWLRVP